MDKDEFEKLKPESKEKVIFFYLDQVLSSTRMRLKILPSVAALAATLLIIATFNKELLPLTTTVKILLSLLLLLIPISLYLYNRDIKNEQGKWVDRITKWLGEDVLPHNERGALNFFVRYFPEIGIFIITAVILTLLAVIWHPSLLEIIKLWCPT